jgi:hypothetical protein
MDYAMAFFSCLLKESGLFSTLLRFLAAGVLMLSSNMIAILEFPHPFTVLQQWFDADSYLLPVLVV